MYEFVDEKLVQNQKMPQKLDKGQEATSTYTSSLKQQGNIPEQMAKKSRCNTKTQLLELILHVLLF